MSQILVQDLTFYYEESGEMIFDRLSVSLDTDWRLGLIGRNGRGKTTFLKLLAGEYGYRGLIRASVPFEYFPFPVRDPGRPALEVLEDARPGLEFWKLLREISLQEMDPELLYRPFASLSGGERTRLMLALLFSDDRAFLLIDEPTNHLDLQARREVRAYLQKKKGFILVSHDRAFLDSCIDHVMALNRSGIEICQGNFSTWWENRHRRDMQEERENERLKKEIGRLKEAADRTKSWSAQAEQAKKGGTADGGKVDRGYIGHKAAKVMKRAQSAKRRIERAAEEKQKLLKNVETAEELKLFSLQHERQTLLSLEKAVFSYDPTGRALTEPLTFSVRQGERILLEGKNGSGKSSLLRAILGCEGAPRLCGGTVRKAGGLQISWVSQDTLGLSGTLEELAERRGIDGTLLRMMLRKLDFSREQFAKRIEHYSEGQKKKVLLAASLCERAHLYLWDEPLNYIDLYSRMQLEDLICTSGLTLLLVEHDEAFAARVATGRLCLPSGEFREEPVFSKK